MITIPPAYAACPGTVSASSTTGCTLTGTDLLTVTSSGTIDVSGKAATAVTVDAAATGVTINNSGSIIGDSGNGGIGVDVAATGTTITNNAGGLISGPDSAGINYWGSLDGSLSNSGTITGFGTSTDAATGVYISDDLSGTLTNTSTGVISGSATISDTVTATGIHIGGELSGELDNSGTISAAAHATTTDDAYAYGIAVTGDLSGTITNSTSGTISATATAIATDDSATASAYGIISTGNLTGSITNNGTITATATVNGSDTSYYTFEANAYGISFVNLDGTLDNTGTISATASASGTYSSNEVSAYVYGVRMKALSVTGALTNSGTISATATAEASDNSAERVSATAYGVGIWSGDLAGSLENSGTISATATAIHTEYEATANAYGVSIDDNLTGSLTNTSTGTISATASAHNTTSTAYANAYGVSMTALTTGELTNNGTITATATASATNYWADASAWGVRLTGGALAGTLGNTGTISVTARAIGNVYPATAAAYGVSIDLGALSGTLTNDGTISAVAYASTPHDEAQAEAYGVYGNGDLSGTLTNSSFTSISATATANAESDSALATAWGIYITGDISGTLTNSGAVRASASAYGQTTAVVLAYGVKASALSGDLNNTGTIAAQVTASADGSSATAYGVFIFGAVGLTGTLTNSGTISGTSNVPGNGFSLRIDNGTGTVSNQAGGLLSGNLSIGGTMAVNNSGTIAIPVGAYGADAASIAGDFTQSATGTLGFGAAGTASYGQLTVGGNATLADNGTINVEVASGDTLADGDMLDNVLAATTLLDADPSTFTVTDNRVLLDFAAVLDGNNIDLNVTKTSVANVLAGIGTPDSLALAALFDNLFASGGGTDEMAAVLAALNEMGSARELLDALNQTMPMLVVSMPSSILNTQHGIQRILTARMDSNLDGEQGINSGDTFYGDRSFWLKPFGSWADQDDIDGVAGYDSDSVGIVIGVDGLVLSSRYNQGIAFSYTQSDIDNKTTVSQTADVGSLQGILYGRFSLDDVSSLKWQADLASHSNETSRSIPFMGTVAHAEYDSWSTHFGVNLDRRVALDEDTTFIPSIGIDYSYMRSESYSETGAGALNLNVGSNNTDELIIGVDGKFNHKFGDGSMFTINAGGGYDVLDDEGSLVATYAGSPGTSFTTKGIDPDGWFAKGGVGMVYGDDDSLQLTARYDLEARESFYNQSASLKFKIPF